MNHYDIAVIGAGAGGLFFTANTIKNKPNIKIALIDKNQRIGRKLAVTGNGRCNLTNIYAGAVNYHGSFSQFTDYVLAKCPPQKVLEIFRELGLITRSDEHGRVYPKSNQANSVIDILRFSCDRKNVDTLLENTVTGIEHINGKYYITTDKQKLSAKRVVIATGGVASPKNGGDKSGYDLLKNLGHTIVKPTPALCPVNVKSEVIKSLKGIRVQGNISLAEEGNVIASEEGEIQFTDTSLSGICVFNLSQYIEKGKKYTLRLSLLPEYSNKEILRILCKNRQNFSELDAENLMTGVFHKRIAQALLKASGVSLNKKINDLSDTELEKIAKNINSFEFEVTGVSDFGSAQVTKGGVKGSEIYYKNMESKLHKGLYIIGEAIDCNGDCGGYNLQFAFATAYLVAENYD